MVTQTGENVGVCAVEGNFDDAQTGVKRIFEAVLLNKKILCSGKIDEVYQSKAFREAFGTGGAAR